MIITTTPQFPRRFLLSAIIITALSLYHPVSAKTLSPAPKKIAILSDGESEPSDDLTLRFKKALHILAEGEITPVFKKSNGAHRRKEKAAAAKWWM